MFKLFLQLTPDAVALSPYGDCGKTSVSGFNFMKKEVWLDIPKTKSTYQVSNYGKVRSWVKRGGKNKHTTPSILKTPLSKTGYPHISIYQAEEGKRTTIKIHRIVAQLFIQNPCNYNLVMHLDDNKSNNYYKNLKWGTSLENNRDAMSKGINRPAMGMSRKKSSLTESDVVDIFNSKDTCRSLAKKYSVNHTCIVDIRCGRTWNHITKLPCTRNIKPKYSKLIEFS